MELLKIRTEHFEGPLDLLLFLIQKNELDISAISIHQITDQYIQHIEILKDVNVDLASEFLVMAATLIHLKSRRLLPGDEEVVTGTSDDPIVTEAELVRRLLEYKRYQEAATTLREMPKLHEDIFTRPNVAPPDKQTIWKELDLTGLTLAFQDILKRTRRRSKVIIREPTSIPERIAQISAALKLNEMTEFASILSPDPDRTEIVVTFIALLELARLKKIRILQHETFGSIYLELIALVSESDIATANGFQYNIRKIEDLATHAE